MYIETVSNLNHTLSLESSPPDLLKAVTHVLHVRQRTLHRGKMAACIVPTVPLHITCALHPVQRRWDELRLHAWSACIVRDAKAAHTHTHTPRRESRSCRRAV